MFDISVRVQKSKRNGAFQIKLALDTVHFHALQRCARINEVSSLTELTLSLSTCMRYKVRTVLRRLMAAESMYYESLASARYVEGEQNQTFARSVLVV